ncbi:glutathione S-transferase [Cognatishimia sp. WU-CL00825]|uniref:glutathione S-transferase n=1 Tax=Cognatishimia sp. WU-CL00825 TaxID=3127658 RepID=UPI00336574BE
MTYDLILGDYAYSSWSLRGWLLFEKFGIASKQQLLDFKSETSVADQMPEFAPAKTVPTMRTADGVVIGESLAMAEELASRHPEAGIWPKASRARAIARSLASEMHAGFMALRSECPMNLRLAYADTNPSEAVLSDIARLETIWAWARAESQESGPWICGDYSAADAFFAPVAARLAGYDLPLSTAARSYVMTHLADPAFRRWRAIGLVHGAHLHRYDKPFATQAWPGPAPLSAKVSEAEPENTNCPYSGKPSTHMLELEGRVFGFCNAFCRDKTLVDPEVWPAFMALKG